MNSVIQEIEKIRNGKPFQMIDSFYNRYSVVCRESDGSRTAYCFSVPIKNDKTSSIVDMHFSQNKKESVFIGSEAVVVVSDQAQLINPYGQCEVVFPGRASKRTNGTICFKDATVRTEIRPTLNGLFVVMNCETNVQPKLLLRLNRSFKTTRVNDRYFSVMREKFVPFVTVSCVGQFNSSGEVIAPCKIQNEQIGETEYLLTVLQEGKNKSRIAVEINLQETKLFQDTTVESLNPKRNKAFGSIAFLGKSIQFGEQWLYSRLESTNIHQIQNQTVLKAILHIPQLGYYKKPLTVRRIVKRFCSFGSNWGNKIAILDPVTQSTISHGYHHLDLTEILGNLRNRSENYVIQAPSANCPVIVSTGDSFYAPQILEVRFK